MTAPMTAAEYREQWRIALAENHYGAPRILAALEEREALLAERKLVDLARETLKSDAAVGALVRRILDHPAATRGHSAFVYTHNGTWTTAWTEKGLQLTLSHLDSLLPKEPEVAPSGWRYEWGGEKVFQIDHIGRRTPIDDGPTDEMVPPCDAPVVAKLMEARDNGE